MNSFNIDDYKGKYAMHCKTKEEAEDFCKYLDTLGKKWCSGKSYVEVSNWDRYGKNTCYNFISNSFSGFRLYEKFDYKILEWSDFMQKKNQNFTKKDLKDGMIIQYRDKTFRAVYSEMLFTITSKGVQQMSSLSGYNDDLTHKTYSEMDIMLVGCINEHGLLKPIFEREKVEEMTLEEVCKELGRKVKIILPEEN